MAKRFDLRPFSGRPAPSDKASAERPASETNARRITKVANFEQRQAAAEGNSGAFPSFVSNQPSLEKNSGQYDALSSNITSILKRKGNQHAHLFEPSAALRKLKPHIPKRGARGSSSTTATANAHGTSQARQSPRTARVVYKAASVQSPRSNEIQPRTSPRAHAARRESTLDAEAMLLASLNLRTGEDVISYFALRGATGPLKVIYLNRAQNAHAFRPYDLVPVPRQRAGVEHFTMSAAGVVVINPKLPSDFQSLSEWTRCSTLYNVVSSIGFFKHFLICKMLRNWRRSIRFKLYMVQRKKLAARLFLAKRAFCGPLTTVSRHVGDVASLRFLESRVQTTHELPHLMQLQNDKRQETFKNVEALHDQVHQEVEIVCNNVNNTMRVAEAAYADDIEMGATHQDVRHKSMVVLKQERLEKLKRKQHAQWDAQMLPAFIRLVDYMSMESLRCAALRTQSEFLQVRFICLTRYIYMCNES
jgi:hypothetical protein